MKPEKIGAGAMGEVYKARDPVLGREVAIKTIAAGGGSDDSLRKRFEREAQSAAALEHDNIITVYDFGQEGELLYMAMEQIADGMSLAHTKGIVHRDLKPANIHIQPGGEVKIMDFGLARFSGSEMTKTGTVMGTPNYMSPEQVRGEHADARSDVFSMGCVFYEVLGGRSPSEAYSMHAVLFKVMQEAPTPLATNAPDLPAPVVSVVEKCLAKDPALRLQNGRELVAALKTARQAVAEGRNEPLPEFALPDPDALGLPASDAGGSRSHTRAGRTWTRSGPGSAPSVVPSAQPVKKPGPPVGVIVGAGVALLVVGWLALKPGGPASDSPPVTRPAELDTLALAVVGTQIEVARKRLDAGDYRGAATQAERALKLAPDNAEAKEIFDEAQGILTRVDVAVKDARAATSLGDAGKAALALWQLVQADPDHPLAGELAASHEAAFEAHVSEARAAMTESQERARTTGARSLEEFKQAVALAAQAGRDSGGGKHAQAVIKWLKARRLFDLAERALR